MSEEPFDPTSLKMLSSRAYSISFSLNCLASILAEQACRITGHEKDADNLHNMFVENLGKVCDTKHTAYIKKEILNVRTQIVEGVGNKKQKAKKLEVLLRYIHWHMIEMSKKTLEISDGILSASLPGHIDQETTSSSIVN